MKSRTAIFSHIAIPPRGVQGAKAKAESGYWQYVKREIQNEWRMANLETNCFLEQESEKFAKIMRNKYDDRHDIRQIRKWMRECQS